MFFLFVLIGSVCAQSKNDIIDPDNINIKFLDFLVKQQIDSVRKAHNLQLLYNDSILFLAAQQHGQYLYKNNKFTHYETGNLEKYTPQNRAEYFGAVNYGVGENIIKIYIHSPTIYKHESHNNSVPHIVDTYNEAARDMMIGWVNSPGHFANIITPDYKITGVSIVFDKANNILLGVQTFALVTAEYQFKNYPEYFPYENAHIEEKINKEAIVIPKHKRHAWNIKAANSKPYCLQCNAMAINRKNLKLYTSADSLYLCLEDLSMLNRFLEFRKDGILAEFVSFSSSFSCDLSLGNIIPNRRNGRCIFNGKISKPKYKRELLKEVNNAIKKKTIQNTDCYLINLCKLPDNYYAENNEINLLFLKKNRICKIVETDQICGELFEIKPDSIPYIFDFPSPLVYKPSGQTKIVRFQTYFDKNSYEYDKDLFKKVLDTLISNKYIVINANVNAFASVEGSAEANKKLYAKRANAILNYFESYQDSMIPLKLTTAENWSIFFKQIQSTSYAYLANKDTNEIRNFVNVTQNADLLEPILSKERYANIILYVRPRMKDSLQLAIMEYNDILKTAMKNQYNLDANQLKKLETIQFFIFNQVSSGKYNEKDIKPILNHIYPPDKKMDNLFYNELIFSSLFLGTKYEPEYMLKQLLVFKQQMKGNVTLEYNYDALVINNYLSPIFQKVFNLELVDDLIRKMTAWGIEKDKVERLKLFLNIEKANSQYNRSSGLAVKKTDPLLLYIKNYYDSHDTTDNTKLKLAKYFIAFNHFDWAKELLEPLALRDDFIDEALILYTKLKISCYNDQKDSYQFLMDIAEKLPENMWCSMFIGDCNINSQILDYEPLKLLYCQKCREGIK